MSKKHLFAQLEKVEKIASASKFRRMLMNPYKYFSAIFFRKFVYPKTKKEKSVHSSAFFDIEMQIRLPSSTDIYLTGGKSHDSEIRLARFLINQLDINDTFIDVGAHYGYFTLLASKLVGESGKVYAFEASPTTFNVLTLNQQNHKNIQCYNLAVSDENDFLSFYEFPNLYSEYNSLDIEQFKNEDWYSEFKPKAIKIKSIILDDFLNSENVNPKIIKIDVEGAEFKVINGLKQYLIKHSPIIIIEFLSEERGNNEHVKAKTLLESLDYKSCIIEKSGTLKYTNAIAQHIDQHGLESENVVFIKN